MKEKPTLDGLLEQTAALHRHLCPRQVLGLRMGMLAGERLEVDLPQTDKRVFVFMETDGCTCDGVAVASGARVGRRTMRMMDFGKVAATFVDTFTGAAVRIWPHPASRLRAVAAAPDAPDRWHAQLLGYQRLPAEEILEAEPVQLTVDLAAIISRNGLRAACAACGEEISNGREVMRHGQELCRACAGEAYCRPAPAQPIHRVLTLGQNAMIAEAVAPA
jgi:formylmethanofuran dehydrogenase subunit E